mgnify:CR=1 FL=1
MNKTVIGVYRNGQIELEKTEDWMEGMRVKVEFLVYRPDEQHSDENWPTKPEEIQRWIERQEQRGPVMTPKEEERFLAALKSIESE